MIQDHPFLGIGWGAYWMVYPEYDFYLQGADIRIVHAHNLYLNYAAEIGLPGAAAFLWFFFGTMITALRQTFRVNGSSKAQEAEVSQKNEEGKETEKGQQAGECAVSSFVPLFLPFGQEFLQWPASRLLEGASLGIGLAVLSIALNGLTDDLLFNIPSSMLFWMLAAAASAVPCSMRRSSPAEKERRSYERESQYFQGDNRSPSPLFSYAAIGTGRRDRYYLFRRARKKTGNHTGADS